MDHLGRNHTNGDVSRWPGAVMIVFSTICSVAYILCVVTIVNSKEARKVPSYQIIIHIGIADIIQLLITGIVGGVFSLCQDYFDFTLNKALGGVMNSVGWMSYTAMADLLAWNRCIQTYQPVVAKRVFTMRNTRLMLAACWAYGLAWFVTFMLPNLDMTYRPQDHQWEYRKSPESDALSTIELVQDSTHCVSMVLCYSAVFFKLAKQARQIANSQLNTDKKERLVLLQSMWICATTIAVVVWFFCVPAFTENRWVYFVTTLLWLTCAGSNAFIYLIFNKNIRRQVKQMVTCGKVEASEAVAYGRTIGSVAVAMANGGNGRMSRVG